MQRNSVRYAARGNKYLPSCTTAQLGQKQLTRLGTASLLPLGQAWSFLSWLHALGQHKCLGMVAKRYRVVWWCCSCASAGSAHCRASSSPTLVLVFKLCKVTVSPCNSGHLRNSVTGCAGSQNKALGEEAHASSWPPWHPLHGSGLPQQCWVATADMRGHFQAEVSLGSASSGCGVGGSGECVFQNHTDLRCFLFSFLGVFPSWGWSPAGLGWYCGA